MHYPVFVFALLGAGAAGWVVVLVTMPLKGNRGDAGHTVPRRQRAVRTLISHLPRLCSAAIAGCIAYALFELVAPAAVIAVLGWGASGAFYKWRESRRSALLGAALLDAVDLLAQLLPAGHSTRQALVVLAASGPIELRGEIARILSRLNEVSLDEALVEAQQRLRQPLFTLIAAALTVGNRSGGRLVPLLQELGRAAHQSAAVQGQLRAEQAQGRLGALVIALMPLALLALLHLVNPEYLAPYSTVEGELLLGALIAVIVIGYAWMIRILQIPQPDLLPLAPQTAGLEPACTSRVVTSARRPSEVVSRITGAAGQLDSEVPASRP